MYVIISKSITPNIYLAFFEEFHCLQKQFGENGHLIILRSSFKVYAISLFKCFYDSQ